MSIRPLREALELWLKRLGSTRIETEDVDRWPISRMPPHTQAPTSETGAGDASPAGETPRGGRGV